jgi:MFS transporter, YNFM family, putative membrane transport protein
LRSTTWLSGGAQVLEKVRAPSKGESLSELVRPQVLATYAVGFNVLFTLVATFTYVTFYLAAPPFSLGPLALSWIFVVYLIGAVVTPIAGRWIDRVGPRRTLAIAASFGVLAAGCTLAPHLWAVAIGLALCCSAAFVSQSASTSFLHRIVPRSVHPTASGIYVSSYYLGGSTGGVLPALAWRAGGWPACVALVATVQVITIGLALRFWGSPSGHSRPLPGQRRAGRSPK